MLDEIRQNLGSADFDEFRMIVAFAKVGPLLRLHGDIQAWLAQGKSIKAVFGIDQQGTSRQALNYGIQHFTEAYVAHGPAGAFNPTFHPKIYLFLGAGRAVAYIGSSNLTVGGTETNFEVSVKVSLDLPADDAVKADFLGCWTDSLTCSAQLTPALLSQIVAAGLVPDESQMRRPGRGASPSTTATGSVSLPFPSLTLAPPSSIPRASLPPRPPASQPSAAVGPASPALPQATGAQALVIQIIPHHNGEVFLSKNAINQDPAFFGWPFTGQTVPKQASNPAYPQRAPDPVVDLQVFDSSGSRIIRHNPFNLNTVYYAPKSEIRITVPQDVVQNVPEYSVMLMRQSSLSTHDYAIFVYVPGSPQYTSLLQACNQTMPSGGKPVARRFGWI